MSEFDFRQPLLDLLAVIHRDGGQYSDKYGIDKSCADAESIVSRLFQEQDEKLND